MTIQRPPEQQPRSALENPMDLPLAFKSWLLKYIEVNPPSLPISQMLGYQDPAVSSNATEIQSKPVDPTAPTSGQGLFWNGTAWIPTSPVTYSPTGLTGATAVTRYVGGTTSGSPVSGTFAVGDWVVTRAGAVYICVSAGTPGTWANAGAAGNLVTSVFTRTGNVVAASGDYTAAQVTNAADTSSGTTQNFAAPLAANSLYSDASIQSSTLAFTMAVDYQTADTWVSTYTGSLAVTATINTPAHPPSGSQGGTLKLMIRNQGAAALTLAWGGGYAAGSYTLPSSLGHPVNFFGLFIWDPVDALWLLMSTH